MATDWRLCAVLIGALLLGGCGNSSPVSDANAQLPGAPFPEGTVQAINCESLFPCASVGRVMTAGGGQPGNVSNAFIARSIVGPDVGHFEWTGLFLMDNHARAGENVALYGQGNAYNSGQTWGGVLEVVQKNGAPASLVGLEVNMQTYTPTTPYRLGVHSVTSGGPDGGGAAAFVADGAVNAWQAGYRAQGRVGVLLDFSNVKADRLADLPASLRRPARGAFAACLPVYINGTEYCLPLYQ